MKTIAIALQKGGTGKTTTCATVSDAALKKLAEVWLQMLRDHSRPGTFYLGALDIQLFIAALEAWIAGVGE